MNIRHVIALGLTMAFGSLVSARPPITTLEDLVKQSDVVVVGQVTQIGLGPISEQYGVPTKVAQIEVRKVAKGTVGGTLSVSFESGISEQPDLTPGKKYLLFLNARSGGWRVAVGHLGAREVVNGNVLTDGIANEPEWTTLKGVMKRVEMVGK